MGCEQMNPDGGFEQADHNKFLCIRVYPCSSGKRQAKLGGSCELRRVHHDKRSKVM
jgi:hypothetical protein